MDQMILFGEDALRKAVHEFLAHYHHERNHQGLDHRLLIGATRVKAIGGSVRKRERLGGLLNYYYRKAA